MRVCAVADNRQDMQQPQDRIRVLIVEADSLLRDMLRTVLSVEPRLELVGATGQAADAIALAAELQPHVALVGLDNESEQAALTAAQTISGARGGSRIVFLGEHPDRRTLAALPAFRAAGWSYLLRQSVTDVATLVRAIEGAAMGLVVLDPLVVESLGRRETRLSALTRRQLEVLSLMAKGYNNAAIARSLVLEEKSVENHINAIFGQLNLSRDNSAHPRVKAVLLYLQESLPSGTDAADNAPARKAA
jgi:DNA-binding NarL/FixJ family response regulator